MQLLNLWSHCFLCKDLYELANPAEWGITTTFARKHSATTKSEYCGWVFAYLFYLIILDLVKNNITFEFPMTGNADACLYVKCFQDEEFTRLYGKGKFEGIDFLSSEYKGYQIIYQWRKGKRIREKPIYVNGKLKRWFYSKINAGMKYY